MSKLSKTQVEIFYQVLFNFFYDYVMSFLSILYIIVILEPLGSRISERQFGSLPH